MTLDEWCRRLPSFHQVNKQLAELREVRRCPWCGHEWEVQWEPCEPIAEDETNRAWFASCHHCGAQGPQRYTEPEAIKDAFARDPESTES